MKAVWIMFPICKYIWKYDYSNAFRCYTMSDCAYDLRKMSIEEIKLRLTISGIEKIWKSKNENTFIPPYNIDLQDFERNMEAEEI